MLKSLVVLIGLACPTAAVAVGFSVGDVAIEPVVTGLEEPWSLGFLPGGGILITERGGQLLYAQGGQKHQVSGLPSVAAVGQGGLLDVLVPRDFASQREIFLSYSKPQSSESGTALMRARLSNDNR
ncbi:MAG: PQQ-dependent sugar dehydrogenase, partial [Boseongicola sp.]